MSDITVAEGQAAAAAAGRLADMVRVHATKRRRIAEEAGAAAASAAPGDGAGKGQRTLAEAARNYPLSQAAYQSIGADRVQMAATRGGK